MKRIISLILIAALTVGCCGCLNGCGGGGSDSESVLDGQTVRIASWGDLEPQAGTELGDARLAQIAKAEEKYGCKIEWVTISDLFSQMNQAASSGEVIAEVIMERAHYVIPLARADALWSIEELGDTSKDIYSSDTFANTQYNGKTYGFWYDPHYVSQVMFFNKNILERNGIEYPYEMVRNKTWTYDAWLDIMQRAYDPANGIMGCGQQQAFESTMMKSNNACIYAEKDGRWVENTGDNRVIEALSFLADCTTKWKVMDANDGRDWTYVPSLFAEGRYVTALAGVYNGGAGGAFENMADDYGIVPLPLGPSATEYVNTATEIKTWVIQKSVPKEKAVALLEFMDEAWAYPLDLETSLEAYYSTLVRDAESLEMLMMMHHLPLRQVEEFTTPDIRGTEIIGPLQQCARGSAPVKSTLDSYAGTIQALLDEYYDQ